MRIMAPAIDPDTGRLLVQPIDRREMARALLERLPDAGRYARMLMEATSTATTLRGALERAPTVDLGDPSAAGWTYLVAADDPDRDRIADVLRPLAVARGMTEQVEPLEFGGEPPDAWTDWMLERYWRIEGKPPHYVLIVGGPDRVPFHFQSVLDSAASVGRVAFDSLDDLATYVEKLLRIGREAPCSREAVVFATDHAGDDPTQYSRRYMAEPLADYVEGRLGVPTRLLAAQDATRERLLDELAGAPPALLFSASHGAAPTGVSRAEQERRQGAIVCQDLQTLTAEDVPHTPFLEGGVVFQFACFGYGTPARSDFAHWTGEDGHNAEADFVAALPKRLLAHPRGPVAFVGHVDLAWLHGFADPTDPIMDEAWHPRVAPFVSAVENVLAPRTMGMAMVEMNKRFDIGNAQMASTFDRHQRGLLPDDPHVLDRLVDTFIWRTDAQNYLVFGDPAVHVRMRGG
ncbi:MAG TPA: hypothetical protein VHF51_09995 [Solirubrobacteraceae bacterium]|nr:hypothetical protein [Solirubrobacteraceae bacterium]